MGLDIYLYTREEQAADKAHEQGWEAAWNRHHDPDTGNLREGHTKEQWEADLALVPPSSGTGDRPSERYPDHLFKRNYLRSSYNDSGFNRAVPDMLGRKADLFWLFEPVIEDREEPDETVMDESFIPKLERVIGRALGVANVLRVSDSLRTMNVSAPVLGGTDHQWDHLPTEEEVLEWYREEKEKRVMAMATRAAEGKEPREEYSYVSAKGTIFGFTEGVEILAVTIGSNPLSGFSRQFPVNTVGAQMGIMPQAVLVYRLPDEAKESYVQSAEIVVEFCQEAIDLIKRDGSCIMHWSG